MLPLAVTLAGEAVFDAFAGAGKLDALLHGHSYTAHPVGCAVAAAALDAYADPGANPNLCCPVVSLCSWVGSTAGFASADARISRTQDLVWCGGLTAGRLSARVSSGAYMFCLLDASSATISVQSDGCSGNVLHVMLCAMAGRHRTGRHVHAAAAVRAALRSPGGALGRRCGRSAFASREGRPRGVAR